ncbi:MAG: fumarylacetoacetate hydrolase family protein [Asticcacaulis sp.]|uniref:fumarylacetoacetate hydrolase family protein n=1 Tax=Asticcacaulis sp. TaxID=1872648 RepID=UPI0039E3EE22
MKLASLKARSRDGQLVVVSRDLTSYVDAGVIAPTLQAALDEWETLAPELAALYEALNAGKISNAKPFDPAECLPPLPFPRQWLDGSSFLMHGRLLDKAFGIDPIVDAATIPIMYQGASDAFIGPREDAGFVDDSHGIDFEAELGMIVGDMPAGVDRETALPALRLMVLLNDWSCRALQPYEMKRGFGLLHSKPITACAPVAVTPDEFGEAFANERLDLRVNVWRNGEAFGHPSAGGMDFGYTQLITHAARTRPLKAGTLIGWGTTSEANPHVVGSACITEKRGQEIIDHGKPSLPFMHFGETVKIEVFGNDGQSVFGAIEQTVVSA